MNDAAERLDPSIVSSLYESHSVELKRFLIGVLRDEEWAADVLQATFAKLVELGHRARPDSLKGWLFKVAFNEAIAQKRRAGVGKRVREKVTQQLTDVPAADPLVRLETVQKVREALGSLPAEQREIVIRRTYNNQKFADIADELGIPLGTVLTRMRTGMERLRRCLDE